MKWAMLAAAALWSVPAVAGADVLGALKPANCGPDGRVDNAVLREALITGNNVPLTTETATALASGTLGTAARKALRTCAENEQACTGARAGLKAMFDDAGDMLASDWIGLEKYDVRIDEATAPAARGTVGAQAVRREALLNGNDAWLTVRCKPAAFPVATAPAEKPAPGPFDKLIIGAAVTDLTVAFDKRGFATLGFTNDAEADTQTITADILLGFKAFPIAREGTFEQVDLTPYVEYERKTNPDRTKELNDLTFGASLFSFETWSDRAFVWSFTGAWQTDDRFNASLTTTEFAVTPPSFSVCARNSSGTFTLRCGARGLIDYADVGDPGDKPKLAKVKQYGRLGLDLDMQALWNLDKTGTLSFRAGYQTRRDFTEGDGDAELWTVELGLQPSKTSNFNFSIGYTEGEALSSLTPTDQVQFKIGVRK